MRILMIVGCSIFMAAQSGCSESGEGLKKPLPMDQVPADILKAAQEKYPELEFDVAFTETEDGVPVYELKGKSKTGKMLEVEVTHDGKILE